MSVVVHAIPCLRDNYSYVVWGGAGAVVVDPGEAPPVRQFLKAQGIQLAAVLCTHHHADHVAGVPALATRGEPVFASEWDLGRIPGATHGVRDGARFLAGELEWRALSVPGHTLGALAYLTESHAFVGDTLFTGGCGRLLEGSAAMLHSSLRRLSLELNGASILHTGHEYTLSNLRFAVSIEPGNPELALRLARVELARAQGLPTASAALSEELATNPFLRVDEVAVRRALGKNSGDTSEEVFAALRARKDRA
jgi:hydroxyacylglutathione hydrolase